MGSVNAQENSTSIIISKLIENENLVERVTVNEVILEGNVENIKELKLFTQKELSEIRTENT